MPSLVDTEHTINQQNKNKTKQKNRQQKQGNWDLSIPHVTQQVVGEA